MIPSPKVATYDLQPEMSAFEVTDAIVPEIEKETADFICLNYANADMVGHTGVFAAVIKAVETVDKCVERVVTAALEHGYTVFLTADHGNADYMINEDGTPNTAHTLNLVPLFIIDKEWQRRLSNPETGRYCTHYSYHDAIAHAPGNDGRCVGIRYRSKKIRK